MLAKMLLSANPYVMWDLRYIQKALGDVLGNIATTFNVGMYTFVIISGVVIILGIVWGLIK